MTEPKKIKSVSKEVPEAKTEGWDIPVEMTPADAREYYERGFKALLDIAEDPMKETSVRLTALKGVDSFYMTLLMKDTVDNAVNKGAAIQRDTLGEVRKARRKSWEEENGEE